MISVRISKEMENMLNEYSRFEKKSKSELIKIALSEYFKNRKNDLTPYFLGKDLFGKYGSGNTDSSIEYKKRIKDQINAKISNRRRSSDRSVRS
jgi:hypothetical protein